jgi:hypothetical protein
MEVVLLSIISMSAPKKEEKENKLGGKNALGN